MKNKNLEFQNPHELFDPTAFGFSHSVAVTSPLKMCFISGQSAGVGTSHTLSSDFKTQVKEALHNLGVVLAHNKLSFSDVVKITILIVDHDPIKLDIWATEAKRTWANASLPTSTLIPVSQLALPQMMIEIDAIAIQKM